MCLVVIMVEFVVKFEFMDVFLGDVLGVLLLDEDDMYEDVGDFEFYDKSVEGN